MKDANVATKFTVLVIPLLLISILAVIMFVTQSTSIFDSSKTTFHDELLVSTASVVNADRDFYQAAYAEEKLASSAAMTQEERSVLLADFDENVQQTFDRVTAAIDNVKGDTALYSTYKHSKENVSLKDLYESFSANFEQWKSSYDNHTQKGDMAAHLNYFEEARSSINLMGELLNEYGDYYSANYSRQMSSRITTIVVVFCIITVLVGAFAFVLSRYIGSNIRYITGINKKLAQGDFSVTVDEKRMTKDELGQLCAATGSVVRRLRGYTGYISEVVEVLTAMANGKMWVSLKQDFDGEFEPLKMALFHFSDTINATLANIANTSKEVDNGANLIASSAQTLAQGASEQASSIEELSAAIAELTQHIKQNAESAEMAKALSEAAEKIMDGSVLDMGLARQAMDEISATSKDISKVIKAIDDIAFQTNILALNAAVEAARAGTAGKGFAVVADEVRNLSQKSAEAAKNTTALIESSIVAVEKGTGLVNKTSIGFSELAEKSAEVSRLIEKISFQAQEQSGTTSQISIGVEQVSSVVQLNSATAEENAAASEELSSQAGSLNKAVSHFELF